MSELQDEQAKMRALMIEDARAQLRQAERAQDWPAQVDAIDRLDWLGEASP